jgi:dipeptidase E
MKLLLTSGGLRNPTLVCALLKLAGKPAAELKVAFIPTAMNTEPGDKGWAVAQMQRIKDMGVVWLDIVEIAAIPKPIWLPRLEESDVIFVNGGNTTYLMEQLNISGLAAELPRLLESRVYVGSSAGSYVATPDTRFNYLTRGTDPALPGLHLVDFGIQAHYLRADVPVAQAYDAIKQRVIGCPYPVYAIDDETAIMVDGNHIEVVGEGQHAQFDV